MTKRKILILILIFTYCVCFLEKMQYLNFFENWFRGKEGVLLIISFNHLRESLFLFPDFIFCWGLVEFLTNVMPIMIRGLYTTINLFTIKLTVVKRVDIETIRQRKSSDTDSNNYFYSHGVITDEWEELENIFFSKLIP